MLVQMIWRGFLDTLFPPVCAVCGEISRGVHPHCCPQCASNLEAVGSSFCPQCGKPFPVAQQPHTCLSCLTGAAFPYMCRSLFHYSGSMPALLSCLKYRNGLYVLNPLVEKMIGAVRKMDSFPEADMLVPVPASKKSLWKRGFNQSAILAAYIGKEKGIPVEKDLLSRKGSRSQVGLGRKERMRNAKSSFGPGRNIGRIEGEKVLLFDDVYTTGATVRACAKILEGAGASVFVLTLARRSPEDV